MSNTLATHLARLLGENIRNIRLELRQPVRVAVRKEDLKNQNSIRLEKSKFQKQKTKKVRKEDSPVRVAVRKEDLKKKFNYKQLKSGENL
jgi:ssDNA-binding replication factor A large subunit